MEQEQKDEVRRVGTDVLAKLEAAKKAKTEPLASTLTQVQEEEAKAIAKPEPTPEEAMQIKEAKIARLSQVLSRGILNDQLGRLVEQCTPPGRVGKLVRNREEDIIRHKNLGFTFDVVEGSKSLHASGDNTIVVGDLVLMTIARDDWEILDEIRRRRVVQKVSGDARREYMNKVLNEGGAPAFDESHTTISAGV